MLASQNQLQWKRKALHLFNGSVGFYLYAFSGLSEPVVLSILALTFLIFLTLDLWRVRSKRINTLTLKYGSSLMRKHEEKGITSAAKGLGCVLLMLIIFPYEVDILVMLYMTFGDVTGGIVGPLWGRHKLNERASLEGSLAVLIVNLGLTLWAFSSLFHLSLDGHFIFIVFIASLLGTLSELLFPQWDDNIMIPLVSAPSLWILLTLSGVLT